MRAVRLDLDVPAVGGGEQRPGPGGDLADRDAGLVVQRKDRVARKVLEQPLFDHDPAAAAAFLGRLEDQMHGALEIPRRRQIFGGAEQDRGVPVMAAGMHLAVVRSSGGRNR